MIGYSPLNKIPIRNIKGIGERARKSAKDSKGIQIDTKEFGNPTECCVSCT